MELTELNHLVVVACEDLRQTGVNATMVWDDDIPGIAISRGGCTDQFPRLSFRRAEPMWTCANFATLIHILETDINAEETDPAAIAGGVHRALTRLCTEPELGWDDDPGTGCATCLHHPHAPRAQTQN